jgi:hypothetical protein
MTSTSARGSDKVAIRIFTVDETSGSPAPGVLLRVFAAIDAGEDRELTTVVSDDHGFASARIDLSPYPGTSALKVTYPGGSPALTVSVSDLRNGLDLIRIAVNASAASAWTATGIPSVVDPDARDALLSPASIGLIPQLNGARGLCSQLMPTPMAVRRFAAFQVIADICKVETIGCPPDRKFNIVKGSILEYEVAWHPLGTSIGQLLNSITLAPCEQVTVAVSDWMRRETASRQESSLTQQDTTQHTDHDRLIMESLNSNVTSKSVSAAFASSVGAFIPLGDGINVTASAGGGISGSLSNTQIAATTTNHLVERIDQAATLVMSHRSSVVFRATADERRFFQTQTVRNNNKCHTETFFYFQVNQSFRVVTSYKGVRDAVLVQYPNDDFDAKRACCNAVVLRPALLDKSLDKCFDELAEALFCCDEKSPGPDVRMDSVTIEATLQARFGTTSFTLTLVTTNGAIQLGSIFVVPWQAGQTYSQTFPVSPIDPASVNTVFIHLNGSLGTNSLFLSQLTLKYHAVGITNPLPLYASQGPIAIGRLFGAAVKADIPPPSADSNPCVDKSCCAQKLLAHLNCEKRFYNNLIWLNEDPNERVMRWSCCSGLDLIGSIENTPIAIYGDFLVFPGGPLVHDQDLPAVSKLVILPTPGVYSEGILGQCNTCEIVDPQRFTDWKCPDIPPDPKFPDPQTGVSAGDLKPETITNQISLTSVPTAPDSILKTLLDTLIGSAKTDAESKALLDKLFDLLKETLTKATTKPAS